MNKTIITGRLTADPELRETKGNPPIPVTSFTVAVKRRFAKDETDFIDVVAWRTTAEFVCKYFTKGKRIEVCGELSTRTRELKSGEKIKVTELIADEVGFGGDKADSTPATAPTAKAESKTKAEKPAVSNAPPDFEPNFEPDFEEGDGTDWPDFK